MRYRVILLACGLWMARAEVATAAIFGIVNGVVADPQQRPVPQAQVTVRAEL
jgi:hypothetical protein